MSSTPLEAHTVRLRLLGPFTVSGELTDPVPTGKARRVLAVLAARRGEFVLVSTLVDALWEDDAPERADRNIAALISRIRRVLGRDRIDGTAAAYRLVASGVTVDLLDAAELVSTAELELRHGRFAFAATSAEQAVKLLDADVAMAGEHEDPWVLELRRDVRGLLRRARVCWSAAAVELGSSDVAVDVASAALRDDPFDEEACRTVMVAHQQAGRSGSALVVYRALRVAMSEQLGTDPSPATQALFLSILRSESPTGAGQAARIGVASDSRATGTPLIGRDDELATLDALWAGATTGTPVLAVVTGEAGIGKSALVNTFAAGPRRTGAFVLSVGCFEAERSLYLQPLVEAVRGVVHRLDAADVRELAGSRLGTLAALLPELTDIVGPAPYERAGPELEHRRSLDALVGFFDRLSVRQPVLLLVEDAQHAGQSTIEALHLLVGHWAGSRAMVVVTERTSEDEPVTATLRGVAEHIELGPLTYTDSTQLVRRSGLAYDPEQLYSWTGGSPLFLTELLRHPTRAKSSGAVEVPNSLQEAVAARIAHVGDDTALLLALGAVLGVAFALDDVAVLGHLDVEDCARRAGRALRAGLLVAQGDQFRFANDIVRQVAYDAVPAPVQVSRHRRAAALLEARPEAAARHLAAAGDGDAAARAWMVAAHAAHLVFANVEAEQLLDQAVGAAATQEVLAETLLRRGQARSDLGNYVDAGNDHEAALAVARELGDPELEARVLEQLGWTALYARDAMKAVDLAEQATELAASAAAAPGALPSATLLLGRVRHWDGDYAGADAAYEQVLSAAGQADPGETTTAMALAYRGALLQHQDRFAEAKSTLARAAVLCRRTGQFRPLLQTLFFTALARGDTGDFAGALQSLDNARRLIDADKVGFYRAGIETTTSWLWQELGQVERAREHAEAAVELAHRGGGALELEQELHALLAVADCDLLLGRPDDAAAAVEAAAPMLERSLPFRPRAAMRLMEMRARWDPAQSEALLEQARTYSSTKYEALALHGLGRLEEAAAVAAATGSDLLIGQLGSAAQRTAATSRIAASLPTKLRTSFVRTGRLSLPSARHHRLP
ncbi:AAA family ATPase [Pseudonocardia sp. GCM10023141]|uniref:AAA family ATPase n=1 Tax=Pseudonocardia sp. GCM10023141 TaxID=3252653 RepID=UPI003612F539